MPDAVPQHDRERKQEIKSYADDHNRASLSDIKKGDKVLLRQPRQTKLSATYDSKPYTVEEKKGPSVLLKRPFQRQIMRSIGYHMSGEVISVLSREGRYYNCHERAQRERDNYDIVTRVIQLISPSQSCDNLLLPSVARQHTILDVIRFQSSLDPVFCSELCRVKSRFVSVCPSGCPVRCRNSGAISQSPGHFRKWGVSSNNILCCARMFLLYLLYFLVRTIYRREYFLKNTGKFAFIFFR